MYFIKYFWLSAENYIDNINIESRKKVIPEIIY